MTTLRNIRLGTIVVALAAILVLVSVIPGQGAITFGKWRDINPTDYATDVTPATFNGIYVRNGGTGSIGAGDGWAVGGDGPNSIISHYDGFSWQIFTSPVASTFYTSVHLCTNPGAPSVGLCSPNGDGSDGWIVGAVSGGAQVALYWDGSALTQVSTGLGGSGQLNSVFMVCHSPPFGTGCPGLLSAGLTYAVGTNGAAGVIYDFNGNPKAGGGWTLVFTSLLATTFNSVYMYIDQTGALAGFAVGDAGVIARFASGSWTESVVGIGGFTFNGVVVDQGNPADAWAVGNAFAGAGQIWHFASGIWTGPVSPGATVNNLRSIFLTSTSEGWIVGDGGSGVATILHSTNLGTGNVWLALTSPLQSAVGSGINLRGVSFPSGGNGWAVGTHGVILFTQNSNCISVPSPCWGGSTSITQSTHLNAVFEVGSNDAWAGGVFDTTSGIPALIHWDGQKWHRTTVSPLNVAMPDVWGIFMSGSSDGWAVGGNTGNTLAETLHWDGNTWTGRPVAPCTCSLRSVFMISGGNSGDGWAVGTGGQIERFQSGSWSLFFTVPGTPQLNSVFINNPGSNINAGWAVGNTGTVEKLAIVGGVPTWSAVGIPGITVQNLRGVFFKDSNHGWIVGASATIVSTTDGGNTWSGGTGQVLGAPGTTELTSVFVDTFGTGSGNGDGWAVGCDVALVSDVCGANNVVFAHWDGLTWTNTPLVPPVTAFPTGIGLHSVYLTSPQDGFAVGEQINGAATGLSGIIHLDPLSPPTGGGGGGGGGGTTTTIGSTTSVVTSTSAVTTSSATSTISSVSSATTSVTSTPATSTTLSTSVVTSTVVSTPTTTTQAVTNSASSSVSTPLALPPIPGFPWESIIAGIIIGITALVILRRRRK